MNIKYWEHKIGHLRLGNMDLNLCLEPIWTKNLRQYMMTFNNTIQVHFSIDFLVQDHVLVHNTSTIYPFMWAESTVA